MLSKEEKQVIAFIGECRNHLMNKDELHQTKEKMYSKMHELEEAIRNDKRFESLKGIYIKLEGLIYDTIQLTEEKFFEYGSCHSVVIENQSFDELVG